jgi:hypothetical protein
LGLWKKCNKIEFEYVDDMYFRISADYGNPEIRTSSEWYVWKINGKMEKTNDKMGLEKAEIGTVINPKAVFERIENGNYRFFYPAF